MFKQLIGIAFVSAVLFSCSSDIEEQDLKNCSSQELLNDTPVIEYEDLFSPPSSSSEIRTRAANDVIVDDEIITVYGCDRSEVKKNAKIALNSTSASKFGLPQGVYVVEYVLCYKNVYKPGYDIWSERSENCGYKPANDFVLGNSDIAMTKERGYEEPASNAKELKTFLLHVVSDLSGRRLDKYDPCTPDKIEWIYSISAQQ